jgi:ubiquinone/menaquinone biosynthesis C-methylase UbiE
VGAATTTRRRYYNDTGKKYETSRYADRHMDAYREFRNATLLSILQRDFGDRPIRILEVGCGTGLTLDFLRRSSDKYTVFGLDVSETMILQAAAKAEGESNGPRLSLGDADKLPFGPGSFDVVLSTRFIHQFSHETKQKLWNEFRRVARPDGMIITEFYARPYHWLRYYLTGGAKGRTAEAYFSHFPTKREVREIVGGAPEVHPLRLPGSRVLASALGERLAATATTSVARVTGGVLMDEYFVVARNR